MHASRLFLASALLASVTTSSAAQGVTMGTRGPGASFGVAYSNALKLLPNTVGGQPVKFIIAEDKADPAEAAKNARTLATQYNVDALMGSPSGPLVVAEDLPEDSPIKPVALDFVRRYEEAFGEGSRNASGGYTYDAYLLLNAAIRWRCGRPIAGHARVPVGMWKTFITSSGHTESATPKDHSGFDDRARVLVRVENGNRRLLK